MAELKPCPFCGGEGELKHKGFVGGAWAYVKCKNCKCTTDEVCSAAEYCADDKVSEAWNRRVEVNEND